MFSLVPRSSRNMHAPAIPGVPDSQAKALDRRRRLRNQLQSFRIVGQDRLDEPIPSVIEPAGPVPA